MIVLVTAAVSALMITLAQRGEGASVRVSIDGKLYGAYSLSEEQSIAIENAFGQNRLVIERGSVHMADADCPDKYCMEYQPICRDGEVIICLPHRLVVEVTGTGDAQELDVIVP